MADDDKDTSESVLFSTAFAGLGVEAALLVPWEARAVEVDAKRLNQERGTQLLQQVWSRDKYMSQLAEGDIATLSRYFDFGTLVSNRDIIRQDEYGNFMLVVLSGSVAVDRIQPWGRTAAAGRHPTR